MPAAQSFGGLGALPAGIPPDQYADYAQAQRQQMIAQALMGSALSPLQQPETQSVRGLYVQPRTGALSAASKIAEALMGRKAEDQSMQSQVALQQQIARAYAPQQAVPQPAQQQPSQQQDDPNAAPPGAQGPQPPQGPQPMPAPQMSMPNPRNPMNLPADAVATLARTDPAKYAEYLQGTPEFRNALQAANGNPNAARQIMLANATKAAEVERKSGEGYQNYLTGAAGISPSPQLGASYKVNPDGTVTATPIDNSAAIAAQHAGAVSAATESQKPIKLGTDANGRDLYGFPTPPGVAAAPGAPPSNTSPPQAAPGAGAPPPGGPAAPPARSASLNATAPGVPASDATKQGQKTGATQGQEYASELAKNATGATEVRRSLSELTNLASQATPAASNEAKMKLGSYMLAAGASPQSVSKWLGVDVGALQAAQKQTATLAVNTIHSMTSRGTNFDLDTFMRNNPNTNMADPGAFSRVVQYMDNKAQQEIAKQKDFAQWSKGVSPDQWETGHTAHWLEQQNAAIGKGQSNSTNPSAPPRTYATEADAAAAAARGEIKAGDRIKVGNQTGAWH